MYDELVKELREAEKRAKEICTNPYRFVPYYGKAADAIEELSKREADMSHNMAALSLKVLRAEDKISRWIPATERLPETQGPFLTRYGYGDASKETGQFFYGVLYYFFADAEPHWQHASVGVEVTHWMPLPEPPKEE